MNEMDELNGMLHIMLDMGVITEDEACLVIEKKLREYIIKNAKNST